VPVTSAVRNGWRAWFAGKEERLDFVFQIAFAPARAAYAVKAKQAVSPVVELCAYILKNFACARSHLATLRSHVASTRQSTVASCG
jgi:hypothetical protein